MFRYVNKIKISVFNFFFKQKTPAKFDEETVKRMYCKIDYEVLRQAAEACGEGDILPKEVPEDFYTNRDFLERVCFFNIYRNVNILFQVHTALYELNVIEGKLICPETGREFRIKLGIPDMTVNEDECAQVKMRYLNTEHNFDYDFSF